MTWSAVARKDFRDAVRSRSLWVLSALFVLVCVGVAWGYRNLVNPGNEAEAFGFIVFLQSVVSLFLPIIGLMVGHKAVSGERESGSIKLLLGLPHSRRDMFLGKIAGRSLVLAVPLALGLGTAALVVAALYRSLPVADYVLFSGLTVLDGVAFVVIGVALSSITVDSSKAVAGAILIWIVDRVWFVVPLLTLYVVSGFSMPSPPHPDWYLALNGLGPSAAYGNAAAFFFPEDVARQVATEFGSLPEWYGLVVLVGWAAVPAALAYWRFEGLDL